MAEKETIKKVTKAPAKKAPVKAPVKDEVVTDAPAPVKKAPAVKKEKSAAFAIVRTGGKQYVVREGDMLSIEKLAEEPKEGSTVVFDDVLLVSDGKTTKVGTPTVPGAKISATLVEGGKAKKVLVVRFKSKSNYRKVKGHRQPYSRVKITSI